MDNNVERMILKHCDVKSFEEFDAVYLLQRNIFAHKIVSVFVIVLSCESSTITADLKFISTGKSNHIHDI